MRKLTVTSFVSMDGVLQAPGGPDEDREGGFEHGGWAVPYIDQALIDSGSVRNEGVDALLLGRKTYDIFAASWPLTEPDDPIGSKLNGMRKYVASRTLRTVSWQNSSLLEGDVAKAVGELKAVTGGEIQVHGSGDLIQTLLAADLVDEFTVLVFPVLVGPGKRLFGNGTLPAAFDLVDSATTATGVHIATYARAGRLAYGAIGPETGNW